MTRDAMNKMIEKHYRKNFNTLVVKISRFTGGRHNAEDTVQEAYTRALEYYASYDDELEFSSWFQGILNNCIRNTQSQSINQGMVFRDETSEGSTPPPQLENIYLGQVIKQIKSQPPRERYILDLFLLRQFKASEIEQIVPENAAAIRKIVERFRRLWLE